VRFQVFLQRGPLGFLCEPRRNWGDPTRNREDAVENSRPNTGYELFLE